MEECIKCGGKTAYLRKGTEDYRCGSCKEVFNLEIHPKDKKPTLKIKTIFVPKEVAEKEWKDYCVVVKTRKDKYLKVLKESYYNLKKGNRLIDIYQVFKEIGLNGLDEPKLAIARADWEYANFKKSDTGTGYFWKENNSWSYDKSAVQLPQKTFNIEWARKEKQTWTINKEWIRTKVPVIPVQLLPEGDLSNYYILWEVSEWEELPPTKDPLLLKRISENMFAVLAAWDITELERSIINKS